TSICKRSIWACECSFLLIFWCDMDLEVSRVPIQKIIVCMPRYLFQQLIHERKREMVFSYCIIQSPIIDAHSPSSDSSCWDQLIFFIKYYCHPTFLRHDVHRTHPCTIRDRIYQSCI